MTELIPLFSYLERLNALRFTVANMDEEMMTPGNRQSIKITKNRPSNDKEENK
jgi:hypothetical protein